MDELRNIVAMKIYNLAVENKHVNQLVVMEDMDDFEMACCIRGYHVYSEICEAVAGKVLACEQESLNAHNRYAVDRIKTGIVIGHLPRNISRLCSLFLRRGGGDCLYSYWKEKILGRSSSRRA